jgi:hypothetical protein
MSSDSSSPAPPGYRIVENRAVSMAAASWGAIVLAGPLIVLGVWLFVVTHGKQRMAQGGDVYFSPLVFLLSLVIGIPLHEFLHALAWKMAARLSWSAIRYGFQLKTLTPYAHSRIPMSAAAYRIGAAMPGIVLGIVPYLLGLLTGYGAATVFGLIMLFAAGGDMMILWLLRGVPPDAVVQDHPTDAGCMILAPED